MPVWLTWLVGLALFAWSLLAALRIEDAVQLWYVRHSRGRTFRAASLVVLSHLLWLQLALFVAGTAEALDKAGHSAAWVVLPAVAAYGPFLFVFLPRRLSGYRETRRDLEDAGASRGISLALTWLSGPFVILGLWLSIAGVAALAAS